MKFEIRPVRNGVLLRVEPDEAGEAAACGRPGPNRRLALFCIGDADR